MDVVLTDDDLRRIDDAAASIRAVGERYPEAIQQMIDR